MKIWRTNPFVAVVAVAALAMGIGFTTTMFSIVHGATRPLPIADADELVAVEKLTSRANAADADTRPFDFQTWRGTTAFEALGAYESVAVNLSGDDSEPERLTGAAVTPNTFQMLGQRSFLGRTFLAYDVHPDAQAVVVLSHRLWQRRFAQDSNVIGKVVRLTGMPHVVVGVMPERFGFPVNAAFWTPLQVEGQQWQRRSGPRLQVFGRTCRQRDDRARSR